MLTHDQTQHANLVQRGRLKLIPALGHLPFAICHSVAHLRGSFTNGGWRKINPK
jgi:hypothetical protein